MRTGAAASIGNPRYARSWINFCIAALLSGSLRSARHRCAMASVLRPVADTSLAMRRSARLKSRFALARNFSEASRACSACTASTAATIAAAASVSTIAAAKITPPRCLRMNFPAR